MLNKKSIDRYIRQCISQAYSAESRECKSNDLDKYFYYVVVDNKYLVFKICSPYERVNNRVRFRIKSNIVKNFGIKALSQPADVNYEVGYTLDTATTLEVRDVNYTRNAFNLSGKSKQVYVFLKDFNFYKEKSGKYIPAFVYEKIAIARLGIEEFLHRLKEDKVMFDKPILYKEYAHLYEIAIGEGLELPISFCSSNLSKVHIKSLLV